MCILSAVRWNEFKAYRGKYWNVSPGVQAVAIQRREAAQRDTKSEPPQNAMCSARCDPMNCRLRRPPLRHRSDVTGRESIRSAFEVHAGSGWANCTCGESV